MAAQQKKLIPTKARDTNFCRWKSVTSRFASSLLKVPSPVVDTGRARPLRKKTNSQPLTIEKIQLSQHLHFFGSSANAGPHYQKLYAQVTHIWGNRKGQPDASAMKGPRLERTASLITVPPSSGKFFMFEVDGQAP